MLALEDDTKEFYLFLLFLRRRIVLYDRHHKKEINVVAVVKLSRVLRINDAGARSRSSFFFSLSGATNGNLEKHSIQKKERVGASVCVCV